MVADPGRLFEAGKGDRLEGPRFSYDGIHHIRLWPPDGLQSFLFCIATPYAIADGNDYNSQSLSAIGKTMGEGLVLGVGAGAIAGCLEQGLGFGFGG